MPEYRSPGVYVEEVSSGAMPIEGVGTSTGGFLGQTERGPTGPERLESFADFTRRYGGYAHYRADGPLAGTYLAYAVDGFFRNGGNVCYVGRITAEDTTATATLTRGEGENGEDVIEVSAVGSGEWGGRVALEVTDAPGDDDTFGLFVRYWSDPDEAATAETNWGSEDPVPDPDVEEVYTELSPTETSPVYYVNRLGDGSMLVTVERLAAGGVDPTDSLVWLDGTFPDSPPAVAASDYDGDDTPGSRTGLAAFAEIDDINMVCVPDGARTDGDYGDLDGMIEGHCSTLGDRFAVLGARRDFDIDDHDLPVSSSFAALYHPWLEVRNPVTGLATPVPAAGHVAGIYARSDAERGVHKAPANEVVRGIVGLSRTVSKADQDGLNPHGVNCIRTFPGRGTRVWGARTLAADPQWKYVNVRRLFLYLEESMDEGTQWAVFENNDERLWARVRQSLSNFLTTAWRDGALMGTTPEEAFYVTCDRTTMTQDDIDNGRLIAEVGVAPVKPAEFVIIRITQSTGTAA
ncbi:phage tail sheath family protein [Salinirubellus sp. GCM10025818]|uniref:phage tail sheath family protein n=1 Tax=Salinirubellus sp. GCM10025818 TaxID=3252688 RepID=UPI00361A74DC